MTYPIRNAGFAMGCLYMTVLGFDNITYGFILQQCVTESILGALVGVSAIGEKILAVIVDKKHKKPVNTGSNITTSYYILILPLFL